MTSIENHQTSYENGQRPYKHDNKRGKWEIPGDYFFACLNTSFSTSHFSSLMYVFFLYNDSLLLTLIYYLISIATYVVPIMFIQSFLGQFSSSGYISVFRIAPFFKGLGYVILVLNFMVLTYSALFAAVPFFYAVTSLVSLPDVVECRNNTWNTPNCTALNIDLDYDLNTNSYDYSDHQFPRYIHLPSYEFYSYHLGVFSNQVKYFHGDKEFIREFDFYWPIFGCCFFVWLIVYFVSRQDIEWIGKVNRYVTMGLMAVLLMFTIKALTSKQIKNHISTVFDLSHVRFDSHLSAFITSPIICLNVFGRGWGTPLVMASHNNFKANVSSLSLAVVLGNVLITIACMFITIVFLGVLDANVDTFHITFDHPLESVYVGYPAVFQMMSAPRFFLLIFFTMISISEICGIVIQLKALLTSFFDEFHEFRGLKKDITLGVTGFFFLTTSFYCSSHGYSFFRFMSFAQVTMQGVIFLLLLLVVTWIYGKDRLQRDIYFMLHIQYPTYVINTVRFFVPFLLIIITLFGIGLTFSPMGRAPAYEVIAALIIKITPWIIIPGYMIYSLIRATGTIRSKLSKLNRPTDWYPVEVDDRQRYEAALGNSDISHPLSVSVVEGNGPCEQDED